MSKLKEVLNSSKPVKADEYYEKPSMRIDAKHYPEIKDLAVGKELTVTCKIVSKVISDEKSKNDMMGYGDNSVTLQLVALNNKSSEPVETEDESTMEE